MISDNSVIMRMNSRLFISYRIISRCYFHLPVLLFYFWNIEIGMYHIIALLAVYGLTSTLSGGLASWLLVYISQKHLVALGEMTKALGMFLLLWGTKQSDVNLVILLCSQVVGGIGFTIALSTDAGLLRQITAGDQKHFMKIQTFSQGWMFIATLIAGSIGSILFNYNQQWPFIAAMAVSIISAICVILIKLDELPHPNHVANNEDCQFTIRQDQRFWMLYYSISRAFTLAPFIGFIPFYFIMVNVDPVLFGAVLSCFTLSSWVASKLGNSIIDRFGLNSMLIGTCVLMIGALLAFSLTGWLSQHGIDYFYSGLFALVLLGAGSGAIRPVTMANLDLSDNTPKQRAIIFSRMERDFGLVNGFLLFSGSWWLIEKGIDDLMLAFSLFYFITLSLIGNVFIRNIQKDSCI